MKKEDFKKYTPFERAMIDIVNETCLTLLMTSVMVRYKVNTLGLGREEIIDLLKGVQSRYSIEIQWDDIDDWSDKNNSFRWLCQRVWEKYIKE